MTSHKRRYYVYFKHLCKACSPLFGNECSETIIAGGIYGNLVKMHRRRATFWRIVSLLLLISTGVFVGIGISIFQAGATDTDLLTSDEVRLLKDLGNVSDAIGDINRQGASVRRDASTLDRSRILTQVLNNAQNSLAGFVESPDINRLSRVKEVLAMAEQILEHLASDRPNEVVIDVRAVFPQDSNRFPEESFLRIITHAQSMPLSIARALEQCRQLSFELERLSLDIAGEVDTPQRLSDDATSSLGATANASQEFWKMNALHDGIGEKSRHARESLSRWEEGALEREATRAELEEQRENIKSALHQAELARNRILFMSWVPELTLRVGIVVLLLFLTQVLLSTYRYTLALSSFYLGRSDAVQLLQANADEKSYPVDDLIRLADNLTPGHLSVDSVKSPYDQVTELAKAWVSRRP